MAKLCVRFFFNSLLLLYSLLKPFDSSLATLYLKVFYLLQWTINSKKAKKAENSKKKL